MTLAYEDSSFEPLATHHRGTFSIHVGIDRSVHRCPRYQLVVRLPSQDTVTASSYLFEGRLDDSGAQKLGHLVEEGASVSDASLLTSLLEITKAHSCEDWVLMPHGYSGKRALPHLPEFEQFVANPEVARHFFVANYSDGARHLRMESELAPWGEFLTIRILETVSKAAEPQELGFLKVLLPANVDRVFSTARAELRTVVAQAMEAFRGHGVGGLIQMLKGASLEVLRYSSAGESVRSYVGELDDDMCCRETHSDPTTSTTVQLLIGADAATISVASEYDDATTGLTISFQPGAGVTEFSATQIRAIRSFFRFLIHNELPPNPQGVLAIVSPLMGVERTKSGCEGQSLWHDEQVALGARSLALLTVAHSIKMLDPRYFLPRHRCRGLSRSRLVVIEDCPPISPDLLGDIMLGGRILSLRLRDGISVRRPDLISSLAITSYPDGRVGIRVENGMRGRYSVKLPRELTATAADRVGILGKLYDAFVSQVDLGCSGFLEVLWGLGAEPLLSGRDTQARESAPNLAFPHDLASVANFELAGRLLSVVSRDHVPGFWSFCTDAGHGSIALAMGSACLTGALEARFANCRLKQLVVKSRAVATNSSPWDNRVSITYDHCIVESSALFDLVTAIRAFFRDLIEATTTGMRGSTDQAFDTLSESARALASSSS